jgi:hypothetical protein
MELSESPLSLVWSFGVFCVGAVLAEAEQVGECGEVAVARRRSCPTRRPPPQSGPHDSRAARPP